MGFAGRAARMAVISCIALIGCGPDLKDFAVKMNTATPKYDTPECQAARRKAIEFTEREPSKTILSLTIGLVPLVGPPASLVYDEKLDENAQAILANLRSACGEESLLPVMQEEAAKGDADAQAWVAQAYDLGYGVQKDPAQAVHWYTLAAAQGDTDAEVNLGAHYAKGLGVPKDNAHAAALWKQAADRDVPAAESNLAGLYLEGSGVAQNFSKAEQLYRDAALHGHGTAQFGLAGMYEKGQGVPQSDATAYRWYSIAMQYGVAAANEKRAVLAARLSDKDRVAADEQVSRCLASRFRDCP